MDEESQLIRQNFENLEVQRAEAEARADLALDVRMRQDAAAMDAAIDANARASEHMHWVTTLHANMEAEVKAGVKEASNEVTYPALTPRLN